MVKKNIFLILLCAWIILPYTFIHSQPEDSNEPIEWEIVSVYPRNSSIYQKGMEKFAEDVKIITKGKLIIKFFAAGEYEGIDSKKVFDLVSKGKIQMGFGTSLYWAIERIPAGEFMYAVPFGLNAEGMYAWLYNGDGLSLWKELYEPHNVVPIPIGNIGGAMGGWFKTEIKSPDSFEDLNIRMTGLHAKVLEKLGAIPKDVKSIEALKAYKNNELDAVICLGPYTDISYKLHRGPKYYYYPGWQKPGGVLSLIINKTAWEDLGKDNNYYLQKTIEVVAGNTYQYIHNQFQSMNSKALHRLRSNKKIKFRRFPADVLDKLREKTDEVLNSEAGKNTQFKRVYEAFKKFKRENVDFGWNKMLDEAIYYESLPTLVEELMNPDFGTTARQEGNNRIIITLSGGFYFESKSAKPKNILTHEIKRIEGFIDDYSIFIKSITIEGHTDSSVREYSNWKLSKDRAETVADILKEQNMLKKYFIPVKAGPYGESSTVKPSMKQIFSKNDRIDIIIEF